MSELGACTGFLANDHELPPLLLLRKKPPPPVSATWLADSSHTPVMSESESILRSTALHIVPLSVLIAVASLPTTHTVVPTKSTARSSLPVPTLTGVQLSPPSIVCSTVPAAPTAQPSCVLRKRTAFKFCGVPEACGDQVWPPSVVFQMPPPSPTIQPVDASVIPMPPSIA